MGTSSLAKPSSWHTLSSMESVDTPAMSLRKYGSQGRLQQGGSLKGRMQDFYNRGQVIRKTNRGSGASARKFWNWAFNFVQFLADVNTVYMWLVLDQPCGHLDPTLLLPLRDESGANCLMIFRHRARRAAPSESVVKKCIASIGENACLRSCADSRLLWQTWLSYKAYKG